MSYTESLSKLREWASTQDRPELPQFNTKRSKGLAKKHASDTGFMSKMLSSADIQAPTGGQGNSIYLGVLNERQANSEALASSQEVEATSRMDEIALSTFRRLEEQTGKLEVTSSFRSTEHNAKVGGAKDSQHTYGKAFDVSTQGMSRKELVTLIGKAQEAGFNGIGIYANSMHFDIGPKRHWGPSYKSNSTPKWAIPYL